MPIIPKSSGLLHPSARPRWPHLREFTDRVEVWGTHRSFDRRIACVRAGLALAWVLLAYTAAAALCFFIGREKPGSPYERAAVFHAALIDRVAINALARNPAVWRPTPTAWESRSTQWKATCFATPLVVAILVVLSLPAIDVLAFPLVRQTTRVIFNKHDVVLTGWTAATRGRFPLAAGLGAGGVTFKAEASPKLERVRANMQARQKSQKGGLTTSQERKLRWYEQMRELVLICGTRRVCIARFVNDAAAEDFALVCGVAARAMGAMP